MAKENNQGSQSETSTVDSFEKMPVVDEFKVLSSDLQEALLKKFPEGQREEESDEDVDDQENKDSDKKDSEDDEEQPKEKDTESDKTDKQDDEELTTEERLAKIEKSYKSLEKEFTRRSQKLSELVKENETLKTKAVNSSTQEQASAQIDKLEELKKANPKAAEFIDSLVKGLEERFGKQVNDKVNPIVEKISNAEKENNITLFQNEVTKFLEGDLKDLEPELDKLVNELFEDKDTLLKAAAQNPSLFKLIRQELFDRNLDKIVEIKSRLDEDDPQKKNKKINDTGVSGKPKTGKKTADDLDDPDVFKTKSLAEQEKYLKAKGVYTAD